MAVTDSSGTSSSGNTSGSGGLEDWFVGDAGAAPPEQPSMGAAGIAEAAAAVEPQRMPPYRWPDGKYTEEGVTDPTLNSVALLSNTGIQTDLWKDKRFTDKYRADTLEFLGEGAMGNVHKVVDKRTGEYVAIKEVKPELIQHDEIFRRFLQEINTLRLLDHPNIVKLLGDGRLYIDDVPHIYFANEFVEGTTLEKDLERNTYSLTTILDIVEQISSAMDHAHKKGVIHRDLKPQNIMVARGLDDAGLEQLLVKVMDFGVARPPEEQREALTIYDSKATVSGTALPAPGTYVYQAPEARFRGVTDERTDIFSLGATLHKLLTGSFVPDYGKRSYDVRDTLKINDGVFTALPGIKRLLAKMIAFDPEERFRSMAEVHEEVQKIRGRNFGDPNEKYHQAVALHQQQQHDPETVLELLEDAFNQVSILTPEQRKSIVHRFDMLLLYATITSDHAVNEKLGDNQRATHAAKSNDAIRYLKQEIADARAERTNIPYPTRHINGLYEQNNAVFRKLDIREKDVLLDNRRTEMRGKEWRMEHKPSIYVLTIADLHKKVPDEPGVAAVVHTEEGVYRTQDPPQLGPKEPIYLRRNPTRKGGVVDY